MVFYLFAILCAIIISFALLLVNTVWSVIDCLLNEELHPLGKAGWILGSIFLFPLGAVAYAYKRSRNKWLNRYSIVCAGCLMVLLLANIFRDRMKAQIEELKRRPPGATSSPSPAPGNPFGQEKRTLGS